MEAAINIDTYTVSFMIIVWVEKLLTVERHKSDDIV